MTATISLVATTVADRKALRATLAAYAGEWVRFTDRNGTDQAGVLSVGVYRDADAFSSDGFTVNVTDQATVSFVGTGVWGDDACGNIPTRAAIVVG